MTNKCLAILAFTVTNQSPHDFKVCSIYFTEIQIFYNMKKIIKRLNLLILADIL